MAEGVDAPGSAVELRELYEAAGGREVGYKRLISLGTKHGLVVRDATISDWMRGRSVPSAEHETYVLRVLIRERERLGHTAPGPITRSATKGGSRACGPPRSVGRADRGRRRGPAHPCRLARPLLAHRAVAFGL